MTAHVDVALGTLALIVLFIIVPLITLANPSMFRDGYRWFTGVVVRG